MSADSVTQRTAWLDWLFPFWSEPKLRSYYVDYRAKREDEIKRKLEVCRKAIIAGDPKGKFARKQTVLWAIDKKLERIRRRRDLLKELLLWLAVPAAILASLSAIVGIWKMLSQ